MKKLTNKLVPGDVIWDFHQKKTLDLIKMQLAELGCEEGARLVSWKSWRAGKASEMLKAGDSMGTLLTAGEWSEKAFAWQRYANPDMDVDMHRISQITEDLDERSDAGNKGE